MVRRHALVVSLLVAAGATACSNQSGARSTTAEDVDRAAAIWQDPWVAPESATAPGPAYGSNGWVSRRAGGRQTHYRSTVEEAAALELALATEAGWQPTSSGCGSTVTVALVGPDQAIAALTVTEEGRVTVVDVTADVRHHLDTDWAPPSPVESTCLDGGEDDYVALEDGSAPHRDDSPERQAQAEWESTEADESATALAAAVSADLESRGLATIAPATLRDGNSWRHAPGVEQDLPATDLHEVSALLDGWTLTWALCGGPVATEATYARQFDQGPAVARVNLDGGATLTVTLPVVEGPQPPEVASLPALPQDTCHDTADSTIVGTPAVLPTQLTPVRE